MIEKQQGEKEESATYHNTRPQAAEERPRAALAFLVVERIQEVTVQVW